MFGETRSQGETVCLPRGEVNQDVSRQKPLLPLLENESVKFLISFPDYKLHFGYFNHKKQPETSSNCENTSLPHLKKGNKLK